MKKMIFYSVILLTIIVSAFARTDNQSLTTRVDTLSTIQSLQKTGQFYSMNYTGDYSAILDEINSWFTGGNNPFLNFNCSLFSVSGDEGEIYLGRNFDNPSCDILVARYDSSEPDVLTSIAFTRMSDLGFPYQTDFTLITEEEKLNLLHAPYFAADGINECGITTGLAYVEPVQITVYPEKESIFITHLIRKILDHAHTISEAVEIANNYNVFDSALNVLSHHLLVNDALGNSVILEYHEGEFRVITSEDPFQIITNTPVYNNSHDYLMSHCWRYNIIYDNLESYEGIINYNQGLDILESASSSTQWSALYDNINKGVYISVYSDFEDIAYVGMDDFLFFSFGNYYISNLNPLTSDNDQLPEANEDCDLYMEISSSYYLEYLNAVLTTEDADVTVTNQESEFLPGYDGICYNYQSPFTIHINNSVTPHLATFQLEITTDHNYTTSFEFDLFIGVGDILVVDDDGGSQSENAYLSKITACGLIPHYWNRELMSSPNYNVIQDYQNLVWFTGNAENTIDYSEEVFISNYVDQGGNLYISGEKIGQDMQGSSFYSQYLHAVFEDTNTGNQSVTGTSNDPIGNNLQFNLISIGSPRDVISPLDGAETIFNYVTDGSCAGVRYENEGKVVYHSFGLGSVTASESRLLIMQRILEYFGYSVDAEDGFIQPVSDKMVSYNYPNPFNPVTTIFFNLAATSQVKLSIFNVKGQKVATLMNEKLVAGIHSVVWNGKDDWGNNVSSGVFFYKIDTAKESVIRKMLVMK